MELTAGYHQASLNETSRAYTAFRTIHGLFDESSDGTEGFRPLLPNSYCDSSLDGLMINLPDLRTIHRRCTHKEDTFVNNVRQVFDRFRSHNMIVNPKKTKLGLEEVEYVGHLVSHKGISFTTEKRHKTNDFERPRTHKEMLMYVRLVNYIHVHRKEHE